MTVIQQINYILIQCEYDSFHLHNSKEFWLQIKFDLDITIWYAKLKVVNSTKKNNKTKSIISKKEKIFVTVYLKYTKFSKKWNKK